MGDYYPGFKAPEIGDYYPGFKAPEMGGYYPGFKVPKIGDYYPGFKVPEIGDYYPGFFVLPVLYMHTYIYVYYIEIYRTCYICSVLAGLFFPVCLTRPVCTLRLHTYIHMHIVHTHIHATYALFWGVLFVLPVRLVLYVLLDLLHVDGGLQCVCMYVRMYACMPVCVCVCTS
jgi:hypothetical protein